ncbi:winged helix-turn-helix transcriptional regulator [Roseibium aggregatum]|uniref:Helix-turn-helix transcriptional regulator n=1 Tax=Roseibium aggregatum TaxID=187304 RepID=A0A939EIT4_9HYPH|nr:helix-turn-helix domain-containing protein [Roseibium aggregatum]MBN9673758.1 helix-turn-helix transcriptional regulator [Roseibium aggregatum]
MTEETSEPAPFICGLDATLRIVSGKWKPLILFFLGKGPKRYGELKRDVRGVSDKMLIQHLKELEAHGVIVRTDYHEIPPRVDYMLSPFGQSLVEAMVPMCRWGENNTEAIASALKAQMKGDAR